MRVFHVRNVHEAFQTVLSALREDGVDRPSRNGPVRKFTEPTTTAYQRPTERVLFHPARDANPFFHLFESIWMLLGRRDVEFVARFAARMKQFSDDGKTFNAAYGFRWRNWFDVDQLKVVAKALQSDRNDRRQVIAMWDGSHDLGLTSKDLPCNTHAYVQINDDGALDLLVSNRSNDLVWGAYGANAVHFSVLQEYLAHAIEAPVGTYYQTSMNSHLYLEQHGALLDSMRGPPDDPGSNPYAFEAYPVRPWKMFTIPVDDWLEEAANLVALGPDRVEGKELTDPFLRVIALPLLRAHAEFKKGGPDRVPRAKVALLEAPSTNDWATAAGQWLERRTGASVS